MESILLLTAIATPVAAFLMWWRGHQIARDSRTEERLVGMSLKAASLIDHAVALEIDKWIEGVPEDDRGDVTSARTAVTDIILGMHAVALGSSKRLSRKHGAPVVQGAFGTLEDGSCPDTLADRVKSILRSHENTEKLQRSAREESWVGYEIDDEGSRYYLSKPEIDRLRERLLYLMTPGENDWLVVTQKNLQDPMSSPTTTAYTRL